MLASPGTLEPFDNFHAGTVVLLYPRPDEAHQVAAISREEGTESVNVRALRVQAPTVFLETFHALPRRAHVVPPPDIQKSFFLTSCREVVIVVGEHRPQSGFHRHQNLAQPGHAGKRIVDPVREFDFELLLQFCAPTNFNVIDYLDHERLPGCWQKRTRPLPSLRRKKT